MVDGWCIHTHGQWRTQTMPRNPLPLGTGPPFFHMSSQIHSHTQIRSHMQTFRHSIRLSHLYAHVYRYHTQVNRQMYRQTVGCLHSYDSRSWFNMITEYRKPKTEIWNSKFVSYYAITCGAFYLFLTNSGSLHVLLTEQDVGPRWRSCPCRMSPDREINACGSQNR